MTHSLSVGSVIPHKALGLILYLKSEKTMEGFSGAKKMYLGLVWFNFFEIW